MAELVDRRASDPVVRAAALDAIDGTPARNIPAQLEALRRWLSRHCQFVADPVHDELLVDPPILLADIATTGKAFGDCDDVAVLTATLGTSIGIPARFQVVSFDGGPMSHVFAELYDGARWQAFDVTRPAGFPTLPVRRRWQIDLYKPGGAVAGMTRTATLGEATGEGGLFGSIDLDAPLWLGLDTKTWLMIGGGAVALLLVLRSR